MGNASRVIDKQRDINSKIRKNKMVGEKNMTEMKNNFDGQISV